MTKTMISPAPSAEVPAFSSPPPYNAAAANEAASTPSEKPHVCPKHGASQTPNIDKHLREFKINARLQALAPLNNALDGESCTKCTTESIAQVLSGYVRDLKMAKKNGQWDKSEKRALKAEAKSLFRGMKKDMKSAWKEGA